MDGEIVLDRGDGAVRLNDSERALMQEIEIEAPDAFLLTWRVSGPQLDGTLLSFFARRKDQVRRARDADGGGWGCSKQYAARATQSAVRQYAVSSKTYAVSRKSYAVSSQTVRSKQQYSVAANCAP